MTLVMSTPQPRPGQAPGHAGRLHGRRAASSRPADAQFFDAARADARADLSSKESFMVARRLNQTPRRRARRWSAPRRSQGRRVVAAQERSITMASTTKHRAVGPVRAPAAGVQAGERHRRSRRRASAPGRRSTWGGAATPTSCSCTTRRPRRSSSPKASASGAAASCTTTSSSSARKAIPAGAKGQDVVAALAEDRRRERRAFISRGDKSGTHAAELRYWKAAGIDAPATKVHRLQGVRLRHGPGAQHRARVRRLRADRPRHLAQLQESRQPRGPGRRRHAPLQPVRRHRRQSGEASARQERSSRRRSPTGCSRPAGQPTIASYKVGGEQLFFPNGPH